MNKRAAALSRLAEEDAADINWPPPPYDTAIKRKEPTMKKKPMPMKKGKPGKKYGC